MKKSLIAAAIAGMFVAPAAMAVVTISGAINTGLLLGDSTDGSNPGGGISNESLFATYSNINIGSVDDLGNGMKVMFNYQLDISGTSSANPTLAGGAIGNRNSYLGIGGDWGNLKWGTNENVYERMQYSSDFMDGAAGPGGNLTLLSNPGIGSPFNVGQGVCAPGGATLNNCAGFYRRSDQTIWYESPNFGGFSFEVDYTTSAFKTAAKNPQLLSIGGRFAPEGAGWFVDAAYETHSDFGGIDEIAASKGIGTGSSTGTDDTGLQVGGGMTFGNFQVNLRYEMLTYEGNSAVAGDLTEWERDAFWAGVKMNLPSGYAAAQFGMANEADCTQVGGGCTAPDTDATHIAVGYFHNLSKQSQLQFIYNQTDNGSNANYWAAGANNLVNGADHKGLYVGIKHTF